MSIRSVADGESEHIPAFEQQDAGTCPPMFNVPELSSPLQDCLRDPARCGRLREVQDVVQRPSRGWIGGRVEATIAAEFEAEVLFVYPDLAAVLAGKVRAGIQVVEVAADAAIRLHVRFHGAEADNARGGWSF
jgi:hypothetical protein